MDALRTIAPPKHKDSANSSVAMLSVLIVACVAVVIGAFVGALSSLVGLPFGMTFVAAWGQFGLTVAIVTAILAFIVLLALMVILAVDVVLEGTGPHLKGGSRA